MKVAAIGRTQWLYDSILAVIAAGHRVVFIATSPASPEYTINERDFARLAAELGVPFINDPVLNRPEYFDLLDGAAAEVAISVNCISLLKAEVLDRFPHGVINAHAGDLPRFRGNAVPNWAILTGESQVVVTLHRMTEALDAGPVLVQQALPLTDATYITDIYEQMARLLPPLFVDALDGLATGRLRPREQPDDPGLSLRCYPRLPRDGAMDWSLPAEQLGHLVRATSTPFAGAYSFLNGEKLIVWRARADRLGFPHHGVPGQVVSRHGQTGEVAILTGDGILVLEEVESAARGRCRAADLIRSTRTRLGMDLADEVVRLRERVNELEGRLAALASAPQPRV